MKRSLLLFVLCLFAVTSVIFAQVSTASLTGLVTDPSGAAMPGVNVTLTLKATNAVNSVTMDQTGYYTFPSVPVGDYLITSDLTGFNRTAREFTLETGQRARVDLPMTVGSETTSVTVEAVAPQLSTQDATVGAVIDNNYITQFPLLLRGWDDLATADRHHNQMEPHATTAVWNADGALTLYETTQDIFGTRELVSMVLGIPPEKINVVCQFVGGGFGGKAYVWPHTLIGAAAVFAEVRVDPDLGIVRLNRFVGAYDCGRVINPKTARSQAIGGIIWGVGHAQTEQSETDPTLGRFVNRNYSGYLVPTCADIPDLDVLFMGEFDGEASPIGAKGLGELTSVSVAPAIANAVYHATGNRVRDLPITIERLL